MKNSYNRQIKISDKELNNILKDIYNTKRVVLCHCVSKQYKYHKIILN